MEARRLRDKFAAEVQGAQPPPARTRATFGELAGEWLAEQRQRLEAGEMSPRTFESYLVDGNGQVSRSTDGGRAFEPVGSVGGQPEAFAADGARRLYVAVHGGRVLVSTDGGTTWRTRSTP